MSILFGLILLAFVILLALSIYKTVTSYLALRRPPVRCPACGRNTHVWGKKSACSRCNATLIRRSDGSWQAAENR